jgi:FkbM family methyltransferase
MTDHSQNGEQALLLAHFGAKADGRFLDIGAWEGKTFSNTYALAERGWTGVCVEPSPSAFVGLLQTHADRPGVELVNAAVAYEPGLASFYDCGGDAVSTLSATQVQRWRSHTFRQFTVCTVTVGQLLGRFGLDFDLLSLDTEGSSAALFRCVPLGAMPRLKACVVEHDGHADAMAQWAGTFGFREAGRNGENLVLLR